MPSDLSQAERDVIIERRRHVSEEDFTFEHDDMHRNGEIAAAAGYYALWASRRPDYSVFNYGMKGDPKVEPRCWPWDLRWWKPKTPREDLVRAGALVIAEIERIDRAAAGGAGAKDRR